MYDDEGRELIQGAIDSLDKLFEEYRADAFMYLRYGYGELHRALEADDRQRSLDEAKGHLNTLKTSADSEREKQGRRVWENLKESRAVEARWKGLTHERRESLVLHALADARCTAHEINERVNEALGATGDWSAVYPDDMARVVRQMFKAGQFDRALDPRSRRRRFVYFRKRGLDGPIADLQRALDDGGEAVR